MTSTRMSPLLQFTGEAAAAMEHYRSVFGGELVSQTYGGSGMADDPRDADLVMHAQLDVDPAFTMMSSDLPHALRDDAPSGLGPVCLWGDDDATLRGWWDGLADGGQVHVPLEPAPWGDSFGQLQDRFGVTWMVNISPAG